MSYPIVFACDEFYVVNKPHDVSFHSEDGEGFFVLFEKQVSEKLYPVHRLDKMTSGLVIVARSKQAAAEFGDLFSQKHKNKLEKYYLAVAQGKPTKKHGALFKTKKNQGKPIKANLAMVSEICSARRIFEAESGRRGVRKKHT